MLDLLAGPALILNVPKEIIELANSSFIRLSGYTEEEIYSQPFDNFFLGFHKDLLKTEENYSGVIKRRNRTSLSVSFKVQVWEQDETKAAVIFKNPESNAETRGPNSIYVNLLEALLQFISSSDSEGLDYSIKVMLNAFSKAIGTNLVCLYQANSDSPKLSKAITCEPVTIFPDEIPSSDLVRLRSASMWVPGDYVQTDIHRAGRVADLKYVATIPLGQEGALSGLLVVGGSSRNPSADLGSLLRFLGSLLFVKTQYSIKDENQSNLIFELENQNNVFTELFNVAQEGMIILNSTLAIARMNSAAELMLGYAESEVQGQLVENILIGPDGLIRALEKVNEGIPFHNLGTINIHRRNGQSFPANLQVIPVMREDQLFSVLIFIADVSQNEQIKVRTQQLEHRAVLGEFTAIFAHEVRNPINNISTGLQLLSTLLMTDDPNLDIIKRMLGDCSRLNQLM
ncbi:MAG: PAS domain-containing protein [Anaerolineaceae bacterium]|nr:PAS domain-containing protein [Anaerolineaceae bacterium]